jgi:5,10-methylenetetrahydromethanopterin reductase
VSCRPRIGVLFAPSRPLGELVGTAQRIERLGFDELWVVEDCFAYAGMSAAAAALASTSHLSVGIGLLPAVVRNVAISAMEMATLATLYPLRFRAAMGHGVETWMRQIGARPPDRLQALREVVVSTRALLRGERVTLDGANVKLDDVVLDMPPEHVPAVLIGTTGPRGIALAGEVADGVLLAEGAGPAAVRWATASLPPHALTVVYAWLCVDDDGDAARLALRPTVQAWRDGGLYPGIVARGGLPPAGEIEPDAVSPVAIAGTPRECAQSLMRLQGAGASSIVLVPTGEGPDGQLERFAAEVMPLLLAEALAR